jgi:hypothetical protein
MSKRLQIVMPDEDFLALAGAAERRGKSISQLVRDSLRRTVADEIDVDPDARIAAILRFAQSSGPSADIEEILRDLERFE